MLIDDDVDDQEIFLAAMDKVSAAVNCITHSDPIRALRELIDRVISPDLIFLDLNMPTMSGQEFLIEVKKKETLKDIPVIILSTSSHSATIQLTKQLGARDFITKPDKFDGLISVLKSIIE